MKTSIQKSRKAPRGYTLGRRRFARISAIEGIRTTPEMDRDFLEFEHLGLSSEERREAIARKYGKVR